MNNPIYPCLWFDGKAQEAAKFYCAVFGDSNITTDTPMVVNFELSGQKFMGLNGGPMFKVNPSISFFVIYETEAEIETTWQQLLEGGSVLMPLDKYDWSNKYGWLQDRYGVSWQLSLGKLKEVGQKFTPTLMFVGKQAGKAEQAVHFYTSIFDNSDINHIIKYAPGEPDKEENVKHAAFSLNKHGFMAMDSSYPHNFAFNEAISFVVDCKTQEEIDYYWNKLIDDEGKESRCGWLIDKYGVSWQIIPAILGQLMSKPGKADKVMKSVLQMKKLDIEKLQTA